MDEARYRPVHNDEEVGEYEHLETFPGHCRMRCRARGRMRDTAKVNIRCLLFHRRHSKWLRVSEWATSRIGVGSWISPASWDLSPADSWTVL
jgi:hypothetical protein